MADSLDENITSEKQNSLHIPSETYDLMRTLGLPKEAIYVIIVLMVLFVSTRLMKAGPSHIFAFIAAYVIIRKLNKETTESVLNFYQEMDYRLELLGSPKFFHLDTNIINLFYNIYSWRKRNAYNFDNAIKAVNNILRIEQESQQGLERCVDNYEIAYDQRNIAMNLIHGFIYSLDHPILVSKLKKVLDRLGKLLEKHLFIIQKNCKITESRKSKIDVNSRFIEDAQGPKPYDGASISQFDYY